MRPRRSTTFIALVVTLAVVGGGTATAGGGGDDGGVPAIEPEPEGPAKKTKGYERTLRLAIDDIQEFWATEFPDIYGAEYEPVPERRIFAAHPGIDLPDCQGDPLSYEEDAEGNAFYCYEDNFVAYDDVTLFPLLYENFGEFAIALVLAHEWGHAIQDRAENDFQPTILKELQADCFAGAWVARVDEGRSRLSIEGGNLDQGLAALLLFRDEPGTSPDDPNAHGSGFDRVSAFQQGFDGGAAACAPYFESPPTIVESAIFTSPENEQRGGNLPPDEVIPSIVELLNAYFASIEPEYVPLSLEDVQPYDVSDKPEDLPECGNTRGRKELRNRVFYCPLEPDFIAFDNAYFGRVYTEIGDFGVGTLLANAWSAYVLVQQEFPGVLENSDNAVLAADCYTGAFARALYDGELFAQEEPRSLLDPGDLDETIQAMIVEASVRDVGSIDVTFIRLRAIREGFFLEHTACAEYATTATPSPES